MTELTRPRLALFLTFILFAVEGPFLPAQEDPAALKDMGYLAVYQAVTDLKSNLTLMSVGAHPDDEDVETLTYYRRKHGLNTVVVNLTRGEGGQNEIGSELYRDLGVIRTYEMERSGAISGATYYNLNLEDFGYSKTAAETFRMWGREEALGRLVRLIRKLKPDVIITNHDTTSGHGHHRATGILVRKAFDLAADPSKFAEHLREGLSAWQPKRLFQRVSPSEPAPFNLPVGDFDPIRGESYARIAARALSEHKSQGMEFFADQINAGERFVGYQLVKSMRGMAPQSDTELTNGLLGVFESLRSQLPTNTLTGQVDELQRARDKSLQSCGSDRADMTAALIDELVQWQQLASDLTGSEQALGICREEIAELERAISLALSLDLKITLEDKQLVRGQTAKVAARLFNGGHGRIRVKSIQLLPREDWFGRRTGGLSSERSVTLSYNEADTAAFELSVPAAAPFTMPKSEIFYETDRWQPLLSATVEYEYETSVLRTHAEADFDILPHLEMQIEPFESVVPLSKLGSGKYFVVTLTNHSQQPISGSVGLEWTEIANSNAALANNQSFTLNLEGEQTALRFKAVLPADLSVGDYPFRATASYGTQEQIEAQGMIRIIDLTTNPGLRVGIVRSYDNTIERALDQIAVENVLLTEEDLRWGDLSQFETIILDIRAYLIREDLRRNNARILDYVERGGNLIVMYQKVFEWNPEFGNPQWAPYSLVLGRQRVTREEAKVTILEPDHPLLNFPNKIGPADWQNWVQERGLYFPARWNSHYESLLAMSDPEEPDHTGGYLVTHYGQGTYIYTSLVWYRQLKALVPGAFRNLANMIEYARSRNVVEKESAK